MPAVDLRNFKCHECKRPFVTRQGLFCHKREVHGTITYRCPLCPYQGSRLPDMLTRHAFSKHRASCDSLTLADFKRVQTPPTGETRVTSLQSAAVAATASPSLGSSPGCTVEEAATPLFPRSPKRNQQTQTSPPPTQPKLKTVLGVAGEGRLVHQHRTVTEYFPDGRRVVTEENTWHLPEALPCCQPPAKRQRRDSSSSSSSSSSSTSS